MSPFPRVSMSFFFVTVSPYPSIPVSFFLSSPHLPITVSPHLLLRLPNLPLIHPPVAIQCNQHRLFFPCLTSRPDTECFSKTDVCEGQVAFEPMSPEPDNLWSPHLPCAPISPPSFYCLPITPSPFLLILVFMDVSHMTMAWHPVRSIRPVL